MTLRAVVYPRVSSAAQRERDTIASQLRVLPEYVARQGWTLVRPPETYVDDGASAAAGKLGRRTGLAALLRDAGARVFDVVVVVDLDRLSRSEDLAERGAILGALQRAGVKIAATMTGQLLDLSTSSGDLLSTLSTYFAAEWLRKHRERVVQGRITAAARGRVPGGQPPYGFAFDRATGAWSIDPVRGPIVREMFERVAGGESCRAIADDLHARGVARPRGQWCRSMVAKVIRSRAAVGEWLADRRRGTTVQVPPIVTEELWQRAQAALELSGRRGLRRTRHEYLLEGLLACSICGAPYDSRGADPSSWSAARYVCAGRHRARRGGERCPAETLLVADADARVWAAVCRELADPALPAAIAGVVAGRAIERRDWEADAAGWRRKFERLAAAERAHLERGTRGLVSPAALDAELARIARERAALAAQLETAGRAVAAVGEAEGRLRDATAIVAEYAGRLAELGFGGRRAVLERLVRAGRIVAAGQELRITLWIPRPAPTAIVEPAASGEGHDGRLRIRVVA